MTQSSWPSPDNTRIISDVQYEELVASYAVEGLVGTPGDGSGLFADATGKQVKIKAGTLAHLRGHGWTTDTDLPLTITDNTSGLDRVDLAVLRLDRSTWNVTAAVKAGTPGAGTPPTVQRDLGTSGVYEMPFGSVPVPNGFISIPATAPIKLAWYLVPGGGITCTSASRPPHAAGRRIYETDTGRSYVSTGAVWVATNEDTGWQSITVGNATSWFTPTSPAIPRVRRINGVVQLLGGAVGVARAIDATHPPLYAVGTIPAGYRSPLPFYWSARAVDPNGTSTGGLPLQLTMGSAANGTDGLIILTGYPSTIATGSHIRVDNTSWPL